MKKLLSAAAIALLSTELSFGRADATESSVVPVLENAPVIVNRYWINPENRTSCHNHVVIPVMHWNFTNTSTQAVQTIRFVVETQDGFGETEMLATDINGSFSPGVTIQGRGDIMAQMTGDGKPRPIKAVRVAKVLYADGTVWISSDQILSKLPLYKPNATETMSCH